jgi:hypothetical protein
MEQSQPEMLVKTVSLIFGGLGATFLLAYIVSQVARLLGLKDAALNNKYFVVDFAAYFLLLAIGCVLVALLLYFSRSAIARLL